MARQRIGPQELADHLRQAVEALAQIGGLGAQKDAHRQGEAQHGGASSRTARRWRSVAASKPGDTRTTRFAPTTTSSADAAGAGFTRSGTKAGNLPRCPSPLPDSAGCAAHCRVV